MLNKLLKYEFKATARWFVPLYIALIALTLINKLSVTVNFPDFVIFDIVRVMLLIFYVLIIIFTGIMTTVLIVVRFYKNMLTDEGYLTHTLPVKTSAHITAKLIVSFVWKFLSVFVCCLSIWILFLGEGTFTQIGKDLSIAIDFLKTRDLISNVYATLAIFIIMLIISAVYNTLMFYCSLSLGSLFNQHKIIGSIVSYFLITFIIQIFSIVLIYIISKIPFVTDIISTEISCIEDLTETSLKFMNAAMLISGVFSIILSIIFFILSNYVLAKKLNLD